MCGKFRPCRAFWAAGGPQKREGCFVAVVQVVVKACGIWPSHQTIFLLKGCLAPRKGFCWVSYCTDVVSEERTEMGARCARRIIMSNIINSGSGEHQRRGIAHGGGAV